MKDFKELLDTIARFQKHLPPNLERDADKLCKAIFEYSQDKFSLEMSEEERTKLDLLIGELFHYQLRNNYIFDYKVSFSSRTSQGWRFDTTPRGNYCLDANAPCACMYHRFEKYEESPSLGGFYACACVGEDELPPAQCSLKTPLITIKIRRWISAHLDEIKEHLTDVMPQLIYIAKFPAERNSGFGNKLFQELSRETFKFYLLHNKSFKALCNQLTLNHC